VAQTFQRLNDGNCSIGRRKPALPANG